MSTRYAALFLGFLIIGMTAGCSQQQGESADRASKAAEEAVKAAREAGDKAAQAIGKASDAVIEASRAIGVRPEAGPGHAPQGNAVASGSSDAEAAGEPTRDAMEATREAAARVLELTRQAAAKVTGRGLAAPPPDQPGSGLAQDEAHATPREHTQAN